MIRVKDIMFTSLFVSASLDVVWLSKWQIVNALQSVMLWINTNLLMCLERGLDDCKRTSSRRMQ